MKSSTRIYYSHRFYIDTCWKEILGGIKPVSQKCSYVMWGNTWVDTYVLAINATNSFSGKSCVFGGVYYFKHEVQLLLKQGKKNWNSCSRNDKL